MKVKEKETIMTAPSNMIVTVDPKAYWKMSHWAAEGGKQNREFVAFARTQVIDQRIYITDTYLVKHEGSSAGVEADDEDMNRLLIELYKKGISPEEAFGCWVHSHPGTGDTATYLSGTDERNIEEIMTGPRMVSIVFDSKGESPYCRVDFREPRWSVEAEIAIWPYISAEEVDAATAEFKEKSRSKSYVTTGTYKPGVYTGHGSRDSLFDDDYGFPSDRSNDWWRKEQARKAERDEKDKTAKGKSRDKAPKKTEDKAIAASEEDGPYSPWERWYEGCEAELRATEDKALDDELEKDEAAACAERELSKRYEKALDTMYKEIRADALDPQEAIARALTLGFTADQAADELEFRLNMTLEEFAEKTEADDFTERVALAIISLDLKYDGDSVEDYSAMTKEEDALEDLLVKRSSLLEWFEDEEKGVSRRAILTSSSDGTYSRSETIGHIEATGITGYEAGVVVDAARSRSQYVSTEDVKEDTQKVVLSKVPPTEKVGALALIGPEKKTFSIDSEITQKRIGDISMNVFRGNCREQEALFDLANLGVSEQRASEILQARLNKLACEASKGEIVEAPVLDPLPPAGNRSMTATEISEYVSFSEEVASRIDSGGISPDDGLSVMEAAGYDPAVSSITLERLAREAEIDREYAELTALQLEFSEDENTTESEKN